MFRLLRKLFIDSRKSRFIGRALSGDPLSIGLLLLYFGFRFLKKRSGRLEYKTQVLPGQTVIVSNVVRTSKTSKNIPSV